MAKPNIIACEAVMRSEGKYHHYSRLINIYHYNRWNKLTCHLFLYFSTTDFFISWNLSLASSMLVAASSTPSDHLWRSSSKGPLDFPGRSLVPAFRTFLCILAKLAIMANVAIPNVAKLKFCSSGITESWCVNVRRARLLTLVWETYTLHRETKRIERRSYSDETAGGKYFRTSWHKTREIISKSL